MYFNRKGKILITHGIKNVMKILKLKSYDYYLYLQAKFILIEIMIVNLSLLSTILRGQNTKRKTSLLNLSQLNN